MRILLIFILASIIACSNKQEKVQTPISEKSEESLSAMLDTIWKTKQEPIRLRVSRGKVYGYKSVEFQNQNEVYHNNHDINEKRIRDILDSKGWPIKSIVGEQGNLTICNVLQHLDIESRKKIPSHNA